MQQVSSDAHQHMGCICQSVRLWRPTSPSCRAAASASGGWYCCRRQILVLLGAQLLRSNMSLKKSPTALGGGARPRLGHTPGVGAELPAWPALPSSWCLLLQCMLYMCGRLVVGVDAVQAHGLPRWSAPGVCGPDSGEGTSLSPGSLERAQQRMSVGDTANRQYDEVTAKDKTTNGVCND